MNDNEIILMLFAMMMTIVISIIIIAQTLIKLWQQLENQSNY